MAMPNIIRGTTKNDVLQGTNGDDHFIGDLGDDVFILGGGQDVVWGGRGTDIARLSGSSVDYDIYYNGEAWWFVYSKINSTDYYQLNTEKIEFSDKQENLNQPTYTVVADRGNVSEGQEVTYSVSTNTFPSFNGYLLSWMYWLKFNIRGVTSDDIASVSSGNFNGFLFDSKTMSGYVAISSREGTGNIKVKLDADSKIENETLIIDFIIQTDVVNSVSNRILDASSNVPTYALVASSASVNEGATATFILSTTNVLAGTQVGYTLSGVSAADIQGGNISGNATVGSNGQATISVELLADKLTEGVETLTVTAGDKTASTTVNDTSTSITLTPTYALVASSASVNEGATATFILSTTNVLAGTQVGYTLSGVSAADIQGGNISGNATVGSNGQATISVELLADKLTEGVETLTVTAGDKTASTTVNDTSTSITLTPTYALVASSASVNEGATATFILSTTNVLAGTQVGYTLSGVSAADIQGGNISGNATVGSNGQATISVELLADKLTEGVETLTVTAGDKTASTTINDTSLTPPYVLTLGGATYRNDVWKLVFSGDLNKIIQYTVVSDDELGSNTENVRNKVAALIQNDADLGSLFNISTGLSQSLASISLTPKSNQIINLTPSVIDASNNDLSSSNPLRFTLSSSNSPTYALVASSASVNEGATATFILSTTNVLAGTQVGYTLSGVSAADIQGGNISGNATVGSNGQATISVELLADKLTEGVETLTVTAGDKTASLIVADTSTPIAKTYTANIFSVNPSKQEGNFSGTKFDFLVELDSTPLEQQRISFSVISNETNSDDFLSYTNLDSTLFFEAGEKQKTISVFVAGDSIVEKDETFSVQINQISSQTEIGLKSKATSIIVNDDFSSVKNFDIIINYSGDSRYKSYFDFAEELIEQIIIKDLPDVKNSAGYIIDDLVINAFVEPIDGLGNILGMAGPTALRASSYLPYEGMMKFDSADISKLVTNGTFGDVVLHEMFHVLGFGTIWSFLNLNKDVGKYVGQNALAEYKNLTNDLSKQFVPLETGGGRGTANSHWSEAVFGKEIMTGYAENSNMPLTRLTIASLVDLGYAVDLTKAELLSQMLRMSSLDHSGNVTSISETGSTISGTVGNDKLLGTARNEVIDGGDGVDVFIVSGTRSEYQISINFGKVYVSDVGPPKGGADTLTSIERIDFTDGDLIFDVISANAAAAYRLYGGAFARTPDEGGFRFWASTLDKNVSLRDVATEFIKSTEFVGRYGASLSNADFVDALYQNVLSRGGDAGGVAYWNKMLNDKIQDRSDVLVQFTQLPEFVGISAANITNGYWVV